MHFYKKSLGKSFESLHWNWSQMDKLTNLSSSSIKG